MTTIDFTPLYRSSIGFDRLASVLNAALNTEQTPAGYPAYNIRMTDENRYAITLAVAGFKQSEIDIEVENGMLTVTGRKEPTESDDNFLYQGISFRPFERKFNLADHVEVMGAELDNGLLTIRLKKEIPEAMKPKRIEIQSNDKILEHKSETIQAA